MSSQLIMMTDEGRANRKKSRLHSSVVLLGLVACVSLLGMYIEDPGRSYGASFDREDDPDVGPRRLLHRDDLSRVWSALFSWEADSDEVHPTEMEWSQLPPIGGKKNGSKGAGKNGSKGRGKNGSKGRGKNGNRGKNGKGKNGNKGAGKKGSKGRGKNGNKVRLAEPEFAVCGRAVYPLPEQKVVQCPNHYTRRPTIILDDRYRPYGRTGNQLQALLNVMQRVRDQRLNLAIEYNSWAMKTLQLFFFADHGDIDQWQSRVERALCIKIIRPGQGRNTRLKSVSNQGLFAYKTSMPKEHAMEIKLRAIRTMYQHINTGHGHDAELKTVGNMCSAIDALFGSPSGSPSVHGMDLVGDKDANRVDERNAVKYSVIHLRQLESKGEEFLKKASSNTGCDEEAALHMRPEYVKSILYPLGLAKQPVIVITDGQNPKAVHRLLDYPGLPDVRVVPEESSWLGGDVALAVMSDAFIGNPVSTLSIFIAKSRAALGLGEQTFLHRAMDEHGKWYTNCGIRCLFGIFEE